MSSIVVGETLCHACRCLLESDDDSNVAFMGRYVTRTVINGKQERKSMHYCHACHENNYPVVVKA